jgi:hypothetical protein
MTQALYAHMNNKERKKEKEKEMQAKTRKMQTLAALGFPGAQEHPHIPALLLSLAEVRGLLFIFHCTNTC